MHGEFFTVPLFFRIFFYSMTSLVREVAAVGDATQNLTDAGGYLLKDAKTIFITRKVIGTINLYFHFFYAKLIEPYSTGT